MVISTKSRKILWARSGNKCTRCKCELVTDKNQPHALTVLGEEAHIVSEVQGGPRHRPMDNYNDESNLIILCPTCHSLVDKQPAHYTERFLLDLKAAHDEQERIAFNKSHPDNKFGKVDGVTIMPKIKSGKDLLYILDDCHGMLRDFEDTNNPEEVEFIARIIETFADYVDLLGMNDEPGYKISCINDLNRILKEIDEMGYALFGKRSKHKMEFSDGGNDLWDVAVLYLMRRDNPNVVNFKNLEANT